MREVVKTLKGYSDDKQKLQEVIKQAEAKPDRKVL